MRNKTLENCQDVKRNVFQERTQNYEKMMQKYERQ